MPSLIGRFKVAFLLSTLDPHVAKKTEGREAGESERGKSAD